MEYDIQRATFELRHYVRPSQSDNENLGTCFSCAIVGGIVSVRDSKQDDYFGQDRDVTFLFSRNDFDAFRADVLAVGTLEAFLEKVAGGTLTENCFTTSYAAGIAFPYTFANRSRPEAGVLRYSRDEMKKLYLAVHNNEFAQNTVPADERNHVLA